jgi:hypothetical protein
MTVYSHLACNCSYLFPEVNTKPMSNAKNSSVEIGIFDEPALDELNIEWD